MDSDVDIAQLRAGDRPAWNRAFKILYAISMNVCGDRAPNLNHHDHEDVALESIAEVADYVKKQAGCFEECKKLVVTIAKNRLLDRFRQRATQKHGAGRVESLEQQEGFDAPDDSQEPPDVHLIKAERALMVMEAVSQIPEPYRKVVEDVFFKGITQKECAERHGLKLGSIGVYQDRGFEAFKQVLSKNSLLL